MTAAWRFPGGLDLPAHNRESTGRPVAPAPLPSTLVIPVQQHIGEAPELLVRPGERVLGGQPLAEARAYVSAPVHAPSSGTVRAVESRPVPHPSGMSALCVVIDSDGADQWVAPLPALDPATLTATRLRQRTRECGLAGLGGAAFPTAVKLNPGERNVRQLIVNGAECEPWITCDEMLMRTAPEQVTEGARIIASALGAEETLIGVEDNKPEAIAALRRHAGDDIRVVAVPSRYPAGGEKQLIQTLTGREVPTGGLPLQLGIVCHNVATVAAARRAVIEGRPLTSRLITVTGDALAEPQVVEARIGTPFRELIDFCGGYLGEAERLVMGGPMMGIAIADDGVPVIKSTNCILAGSPELFPPARAALPCIRCGACAEACPASLLPQQLYWHAQSRDFERVQDYALFDCIECGACAYVCPSHIPLVQYFRFAKGSIWEQEKERQRSDAARRRHQFRQERLEREEAEKRARRERKKAALRERQRSGGEGAGGDAAADKDERKAAIDAALAKARRRQDTREQGGGSDREDAD